VNLSIPVLRDSVSSSTDSYQVIDRVFSHVHSENWILYNLHLTGSKPAIIGSKFFNFRLP
jgi:hypothetical protein